MAMYKLTTHAAIVRTTMIDDVLVSAQIPIDPENSDYQEYLDWMSQGNTPDPADPDPLTYQANVPTANRIQTTDATPTELFRRRLAHQNTMYSARFTVQSVDMTTPSNRKTIVATVSATRVSAAAIDGFTVLATHAVGSAGWVVSTPTADNTGDNADVVISVTGLVGRTIAWSIVCEFLSYTPAGA
jgi:hypothetical protein